MFWFVLENIIWFFASIYFLNFAKNPQNELKLTDTGPTGTEKGLGKSWGSRTVDSTLQLLVLSPGQETPGPTGKPAHRQKCQNEKPTSSLVTPGLRTHDKSHAAPQLSPLSYHTVQGDTLLHEIPS
jgi:hypothetical protein